MQLTFYPTRYRYPWYHSTLVNSHQNMMWCLILPHILLGILLSGSSGSKIYQPRQGLLSIPHIGRHVTQAYFAGNNIYEILRITFADSTRLKVMNETFIWTFKQIMWNKYANRKQLSIYWSPFKHIADIFVIWYLVMIASFYAEVNIQKRGYSHKKEWETISQWWTVSQFNTLHRFIHVYPLWWPHFVPFSFTASEIRQNQNFAYRKIRFHEYVLRNSIPWWQYNCAIPFFEDNQQCIRPSLLEFEK